MTYTPVAEPLESAYPVDADWYWADEEQSTIKSIQADNSTIFISVESPAYDSLVRLGVEIADYVAPPEPTPLTSEEKVARLLADYDLTMGEFTTVLNS